MMQVMATCGPSSQRYDSRTASDLLRWRSKRSRRWCDTTLPMVEPLPVTEGPNIAHIAAVIGERGRAEILMALMSGRALTATELADAAGVTRPTVSSHLGKLQQARLVAAASQGRHRYFRI